MAVKPEAFIVMPKGATPEEMAKLIAEELPVLAEEKKAEEITPEAPVVITKMKVSTGIAGEKPKIVTKKVYTKAPKGLEPPKVTAPTAPLPQGTFVPTPKEIPVTPEQFERTTQKFMVQEQIKKAEETTMQLAKNKESLEALRKQIEESPEETFTIEDEGGKRTITKSGALTYIDVALKKTESDLEALTGFRLEAKRFLEGEKPMPVLEKPTYKAPTIGSLVRGQLYKMEVALERAGFKPPLMEPITEAISGLASRTALAIKAGAELTRSVLIPIGEITGIQAPKGEVGLLPKAFTYEETIGKLREETYPLITPAGKFAGFVGEIAGSMLTIPSIVASKVVSAVAGKVLQKVYKPKITNVLAGQTDDVVDIISKTGARYPLQKDIYTVSQQKVLKQIGKSFLTFEKGEMLTKAGISEFETLAGGQLLRINDRFTKAVSSAVSVIDDVITKSKQVLVTGKVPPITVIQEAVPLGEIMVNGRAIERMYGNVKTIFDKAFVGVTELDDGVQRLIRGYLATAEKITPVTPTAPTTVGLRVGLMDRIIMSLNKGIQKTMDAVRTAEQQALKSITSKIKVPIISPTATETKVKSELKTVKMPKVDVGKAINLKVAEGIKKTAKAVSVPTVELPSAPKVTPAVKVAEDLSKSAKSVKQMMAEATDEVNKNMRGVSQVLQPIIKQMRSFGPAISEKIGQILKVPSLLAPTPVPVPPVIVPAIQVPEFGYPAVKPKKVKEKKKKKEKGIYRPTLASVILEIRKKVKPKKAYELVEERPIPITKIASNVKKLNKKLVKKIKKLSKKR